jgi:predicted NAD-dependent protein-ADP-ribosyltransferase YbiA (DUF1768 family)
MNATWWLILNTKLEACPQFRKELKATGDKILIELDGKAKYKSDSGNAPFWTGMLKDGVIYGQNYMGKKMMEVRAVML